MKESYPVKKIDAGEWVHWESKEKYNRLETVPDYDKFSRENWKSFDREQGRDTCREKDLRRQLLEKGKENDKLKGYLGWAAIVVMVLLGFWAKDHPFLADNIYTAVVGIGILVAIGSIVVHRLSLRKK